MPASDTNIERNISENRAHKQELLSLSNSYSNYLRKSLDQFLNSNDNSIDKPLVTKITQIHKDKKEITKQHEQLMQALTRLQKTAEHLELDLHHSKKFLLKRKLIKFDSTGIINNVQKKSELMDQDIRILENTVRLLEQEDN